MIMRFSEDDGELIANFFFLGHAQIKYILTLLSG
jgi:hypothetical protein